MKSFIFIFCMFYNLFVYSQTKTNATDQVIDNMRSQELSWNKGDINGFMQHYWRSDSLKFVSKKGITYGWQNTFDNYLRAYPGLNAMGTLNFTIIETTALSETSVYVIGKWELKKENPVNGHFTLLWKKIKGKWVIVSDHTS